MPTNDKRITVTFETRPSHVFRQFARTMVNRQILIPGQEIFTVVVEGTSCSAINII